MSVRQLLKILIWSQNLQSFQKVHLFWWASFLLRSLLSLLNNVGSNWARVYRTLIPSICGQTNISGDWTLELETKFREDFAIMEKAFPDLKAQI